MAWLDELAATYPDIATVTDVGLSYEGRTMKLLKLSTGGDKEAIFVDGGTNLRILYCMEKFLICDQHYFYRSLHIVTLFIALFCHRTSLKRHICPRGDLVSVNIHASH